jgi:gliding motility-associated protein GldL
MKTEKVVLTKESVINFITSIGAAIVIFGAWSKLTHQEFADVMLTIGLFTECAIFLIYAFLPPKEDKPQKVITHQHHEQVQVDMEPVKDLNRTLKNIYKGA